MAERIAGSGVCRIHLVSFAQMIVGEHDIGTAGIRLRFYVFGAVHGRSPQEIGCPSRLDNHVSLRRKTIICSQWSIAVHKRQPVQAAIFVESGHVKGAGVEQIQVRCPI